MKYNCAFTLILLSTGCNNTAEVSGTVKLDGKPLVSGSVIIDQQGAKRPVYGVIQPDGSYTIKDCPLGEGMVGVSSTDPNAGTASPEPRRPGDPKSKLEPSPEQKVEGWFPIPAKYRDPLNSGLRLEVKEGKNNYDIDLTAQ